MVKVKFINLSKDGEEVCGQLEIDGKLIGLLRFWGTSCPAKAKKRAVAFAIAGNKPPTKGECLATR